MALFRSNKSSRFFLMAAVLSACLIWLLGPGDSLQYLGGKIESRFHQIFYSPIVKLFRDIILSPGFFLVLAFTLLLERLIPAQPNRKFFSVSRLQDFVWFFYETVLHAAIVTTYFYWICNFYKAHFEFLTIHALDEWHGWARFLIGTLLLDFCYYAQHWVNHKVPWFWQLHTVHHSQKELNFFTDFRYHVLEYIVRETFLAIPFLILHVDMPVIVYFSIFRRWHTRFYHANIRTNLGFLRYIIVTPQSHRVHHSKEIRHRDKNFGSIFTVWDFMFGTQYRKYDEYPEIGIDDDHFPHEKSRKIKDLLMTPLVQMMYPLRVIGGQVGARLRGRKK